MAGWTRAAALLLLVVLYTASGADVAAGRSSQSADQRAVFKSGVDLVTVDVAVVNGHGEPLAGLTASDFELTVNGSPRRIIWAEFVRTETAPPLPVSADHFSTNEGARSGRLVVVAVDQAHIRRVEGLAALRSAAAFIDALSPDDRVAVLSLEQTERVEFTAEHAFAKRRLERLSGTATAAQTFYNIGLTEALGISEGSRIVLEQVVRRECGQTLSQLTDLRRLAESSGAADPCPAQVELEGRSIAQQARMDARMSLNALRALVAQLAEIEGPKTIVLISEGLVAEPQLFDLSALGAAAHDAQVTLYVLQLDLPLLDASQTTSSPTLYADTNLRGDGLARLAGTARGAMFRLVGSDPRPFERIRSELSAHYLLAFQPAPGDRDGAVRRLDVKVPGRGATVRARPDFRIRAALPPHSLESEIVRLLRDPRAATELPIRALTHAYRRTDGPGVRTIFAAETTADQDVTIGYVIVNASGVIAKSGADIATAGRYFGTADLPDGRYMLKLAIIDRAGRRGSLERQFDVRLRTAGATPVGDLMIAEPAAALPAAARVESAAGAPAALALHPIVAVVRGPELVAYAEVYAENDWVKEPGAIRIEVDAGEAVPAQPLSLVVERGGVSRWIVTGRFPLHDAASGPRLLTLTITPPDGEPLRLSRVFTCRQ